MKVSIIMPALNEAAFIEEAITSLIPKERETLDYEILVLDGGSTDDTRAIVQGMSVKNPRIRCIANEKKLQSAAVNKGARLARPDSDILIRADCHATYPPHFVETLANELKSRNAASVVVTMRAEGEGFTQRAIAAAQNSRLGNGGASHRNGAASRFVDHGHHAAFLRSAFAAINGYDESLACNEDAELDLRLVKCGYRIWHSDAVSLTYFPRSSFCTLARQYFRYGFGRATTLMKHKRWPAYRQGLPLAALLTSSSSLAMGAVFSALFLLPIASYMAVCFSWGVLLAIRQRDTAVLMSGPAGVTMHHAWALGFICAAVKRSSHLLCATTGTTERGADAETTALDPAHERDRLTWLNHRQ